MQQNLAFAHQHLWCKPYLLPLIFLFVWTPRALVAAPANQPVLPVRVEYYERGGIANLKVEWDKIQP